MRVVLTLALLGVGLFLFVRTLENKSLYFPMRVLDGTPADVGFEFQELRIPSQKNILAAWYIPSSEAQPLGTCLLLHGNAGNISHRLEKLKRLNHLGLNVCLLDYRGYGASTGKPSEHGLYADAQAATDYLADKFKVASHELIVYGESLGGAIAIDLASKRPLRALITEDTFTGLAQIAKRHYPFVPRWMLATEFNSIKKIESVQIPKLIIHSREDELIPYDMGRELYAAAPEPKTFLSLHGSHNSAFLESEATYLEGLKTFLKSLAAS